jgi:hypothetical protein
LSLLFLFGYINPTFINEVFLNYCCQRFVGLRSWRFRRTKLSATTYVSLEH